ncbi:hypothetical protein GCM10010168_39640 [Actinoplanes ianthinogenes]|uniref:Uncharacterized protein n=1 Tax=Actinoplanes ianthinogenes TaxID=122358 RepID=A0ABN6CE12_9ACTN|nr:hypothetical protein [Actinoplanes ianthinogenes]BCJ43727.1 hypothetical protein Aiant_43840 [Actinoplanes ianthinogenes]GGR18030.1 hypothetical protein GCM10010168_39640 [Actinoplanes ianthinogenes]
MSYAALPSVSVPSPPAGERPAAVTTASAMLWLMGAAGLVYAIATVAVAPGTVSRFRDAAGGDAAENFASVVWLDAALAAVLSILAFALFVVLGLALRRGSRVARIAALVVSALGVLGGLGSFVTVVAQRSGDPVPGSLGDALGSAYPEGWLGLNVVVCALQVLAYLAVGAMLLAAPRTYFGYPPKPATAAHPVAPGMPGPYGAPATAAHPAGMPGPYGAPATAAHPAGMPGPYGAPATAPHPAPFGSPVAPGTPGPYGAPASGPYGTPYPGPGGYPTPPVDPSAYMPPTTATGYPPAYPPVGASPATPGSVGLPTEAAVDGSPAPSPSVPEGSPARDDRSSVAMTQGSGHEWGSQSTTESAQGHSGPVPPSGDPAVNRPAPGSDDEYWRRPSQ